MTEPAAQKLSEKFKLTEVPDNKEAGLGDDRERSEPVGGQSAAELIKPAEKSAIATIQENDEGNHGPAAGIDRPTLYEPTPVKNINAGLRRHRLIVAACLLTAAGIFAMSAVDLKPLLKTTGEVDKAMRFTPTPKQAKLSPDLAYALTNNQLPEGLYKVTNNGWGERKFGYVNRTGNLVVPTKFSRLSAFSEGLAAATDDKSIRLLQGYIDKDGHWVIPARYSEAAHFKDGVAIVNDAGSYKLIDKTGKVIFTASKMSHSRNSDQNRSQDISDGFEKKELNPDGTSTFNIIEDLGVPLRRVGPVFVTRNASGLESLIDNTGKALTPSDMESIIPMSVDTTTGVINGRSSYPNEDEIRPAEAENKDSYFLKFQKNGMWGLMDAKGKEILPAIYQRIISYKNDHAAVYINNKYGFVDATGKVKIKPVYDYVTAYDSIIAVKTGDKWDFIDRDGNRIQAPEVDGISHTGNGKWFSEGMGAVLKDKKIGFINKYGKFVVPPKYEWAYSYKNGLAPVWDGTFWHFIDKTGKRVSRDFAEAESLSAGKAQASLPGQLYRFADYREIENFNNRITNMQNQIKSKTYQKKPGQIDMAGERSDEAPQLEGASP